MEAAGTAPTAPHALEGDEGARGRRNGPERFWRSWRWLFTGGLIVSAILHAMVSPWQLRSGLTFEIREVDDELNIPVELVAGDFEPPPPAPTTGAKPSAADEPPGGAGVGGPDAAAPVLLDAGLRDAMGDAAHDAGRRKPRPRPDSGASLEAGAVALGDAAGVEGGLLALDDAGVEEGGASEPGAVAVNDGGLGDGAMASTEGGAGASGGRDPLAGIGAAGVQAGPNLVSLLLNVEVIRQHPVGARIGPLLSGIPQWDEALAGTSIDPVRDADWVLISGPSLIHTERDVIFIRYNAPDSVADDAVEALRKRSHNGAGFDAGVPGVRATLGHADRAPRVFMRPQSHLLVVVPPDFAHTAAKALVKAKIAPHVRPGEAVRLHLHNPHRPFPAIPEAVTEADLWVVPRSDGGADVYVEGATADAEVAAEAAANLKTFLNRFRNSGEGIMANLVTHGLLTAIEVSSNGGKVVAHVRATRDQVEAIFQFVAAQLGVSVPPAPGVAPPP